MQERHRIGGLLLFVMFCMGLNFMAVAPLLPLIMERYQVSQAMASLLIGGVSLVLALGMTPAGVLASRIGVKRALGLGAFLAGASALMPLAPDFTIVLGLRIVFSLGAALLIPTASVFVMQWFPLKELPLWNAAVGAVQSVGITVSMWLGAPLAASFGWQVPLALYGAMALAAGVVWMLAGKNNSTAVSSRQSLGQTLAAMKEPTTLILALGFGGPIAQFTALTTWLPTYYSTERGMDLTQAATLVSLLSLIGIPATLLGGILPQRLGVRKPFVLWCAYLVGISGAGSSLLPWMPLVVLSLLVVGVCSWLYFPVLTTMTMELPGMTPGKVGVVLAAAIGLGNLSAFFSPLLVGYLSDVTGSLVPGLMVCAVVSMSLLVAGLMLPETGQGIVIEESHGVIEKAGVTGEV